MKYSPKQVRSHILPPPIRPAPLPPSFGHLPRHVVVVSLAVHTATEEREDVVEIREIDLDGDVVYPGLYSLKPPIYSVQKDVERAVGEGTKAEDVPFWVDSRLEDE